MARERACSAGIVRLIFMAAVCTRSDEAREAMGASREAFERYRRGEAEPSPDELGRLQAWLSHARAYSPLYDPRDDHGVVRKRAGLVERRFHAGPFAGVDRRKDKSA